jgi:hypothetical protein
MLQLNQFHHFPDGALDAHQDAPGHDAVAIWRIQ